jgi:hypothetical protein
VPIIFSVAFPLHNEGTDYLDRLSEWIRHEDEIFMNRANLFVAVESIFLATFAAVLAINRAELFTLKLLAFVGAGMTACWLYVSTAHFVGIISPMKDELEEADDLYAKINAYHRHHPTTWVIGVVVPLVILIVWVLLLLILYSLSSLLSGWSQAM